jgi:glyoxylase-like metal-dependent hydrolase (beta-lactamase superfamily II)
MNISKKCLTGGVLGLLWLLAPAATVAQEPVWDGNTVQLQAEKLGDGIYAVVPDDAAEKAPKGIPVATSAGFVIGNNGVLVIDSMLNERLAIQLINLVKQVTDKPIRYVVNTSFHGDHSYGNYVFSPSTTIIQHAVTKAFVDEHFEKDTAFMIQNFGAGRGIEEVVPRTGDILIPEGGSLVIDLGGKAVELRDFGFAQTGGDLFVWVPGAKVLWAGNAVIAQKPALPWLLDGHLVETLATLQSLDDFIPADTRVIPGHGPVTDRAAIEWNIDYLTRVRNEVATAIKDGLTLEQTVEKVKLPEFAGYGLFGWVHPSLNVPAAYKDLSKGQ